MRALIAVAILFSAGRAHAYVDGTLFGAPAVEGGAGGRYFTGAPADGYVCGVCHRGGGTPPISIEGIPADGWDPGGVYDLTLVLPMVRSSGGALEIADQLGLGQGTLEAIPDAELADAERCRSGLPATSLVPLPGRLVARADVCGAMRARVRWTAPATPITDLRIHAAVVAGNDSGDPAGDGAAFVALPLRLHGAPETPGAMLTQRCSAGGGGAALPLALVLAVALLASRRR